MENKTVKINIAKDELLHARNAISAAFVSTSRLCEKIQNTAPGLNDDILNCLKALVWINKAKTAVADVKGIFEGIQTNNTVKEDEAKAEQEGNK